MFGHQTSPTSKLELMTWAPGEHAGSFGHVYIGACAIQQLISILVDSSPNE